MTAIDPAAGRVELDGGGGEVSFDVLLLTTGSSPRRLELPGAELDGIHYLRTIADSDAIRGRLEHGGHVAVVGSGWIGSEIAASARQRGLDVTRDRQRAAADARSLGPELGQFYRDVHAGQGVEFVLDDGAAAFEGDGSVQRVRTQVGPGGRVRLRRRRRRGHAQRRARPAGRARHRQRHPCRPAGCARSAPNVFAAGDIANHWHPFYEQRVRVEHWANALNQGPAAARSMLGDRKPYDELPYFFSDQYDVGMEYSGLPDPQIEVVFRGDREGGEFIAFWLRDGRVTAGMNVNVWDVNEHVQALIRSRKQIDVAALTDTGHAARVAV